MSRVCNYRYGVLLCILLASQLFAEPLLPKVSDKNERVDMSQKEVDELNGKGMYCEVEFTVTKEGNTSDIKVIYCPEKYFEAPALEAAANLKYPISTSGGRAINQYGVTHKFWLQPAK